MDKGNKVMKKQYSSWLGIGIALTGAAFMIIGIFRGEMATVLMKAVNICLECIGIG